MFSVLVCLASFSPTKSEYAVSVTQRFSKTDISFVDGTSSYSQVFNPTWVEPTAGTNFRSGLLVRTQNCPSEVGGDCVFCGGSEAKASILTYAELLEDGTLASVDETSVVFGPGDPSDTWGTEDPRMAYNSVDGLYYMFYTAYNGSSILLSLATSTNPTSPNEWTRVGPIFPTYQNSKSGALLLRSSGPHYLFWGDSSIRVTQSSDPKHWPDIGEVILSPRADSFDSKLVESGPPPLTLSTGDYLFFYNSASIGWPDEPGSAYHVGWVILDKTDPTKILQRSNEPLMTPEYPWEIGSPPYTCNVPNVIFLEAAKQISPDQFQVYFGGADAVVGSAVITVTYF